MSMRCFVHAVKWFQLLLYSSHKLTSVICLHIVCSIWLIDRTLSGATNMGQSGPGSNGKEGVFYIPQTSKTGASPSDGLMSYLGHSQRYSRCVLQPQLTGLIWPIDETLTVTTTTGQNGPGSNGNEVYSTLLRFPEQEFHCQMQFSVFSRGHLLMERGS